MATVKSDVVTLLDSTDPSKAKVESNLLHGTLRVAAFSFDSGAAGPAVADIVQLVVFPIGSRVLAIYVAHDAMSSGAGTAGADFGDSDDVDRYVAALDMDAASTGKWLALRQEDANLADKVLGIGFKNTKVRRLDAKVTGEAWAANKRLDGFVVYSVE
jgi:hypothetical protein